MARARSNIVRQARRRSSIRQYESVTEVATGNKPVQLLERVMNFARVPLCYADDESQAVSNRRFRSRIPPGI